MKARLGTPKAITATAHKLARLIYAMLKHGTAHGKAVWPSMSRSTGNGWYTIWSRRARELGYEPVAKRKRSPQGSKGGGGE